MEQQSVKERYIQGTTIRKREIYPWDSNKLKRDVFMEQQSVKKTIFFTPHKRMKAKNTLFAVVR